MQATRELFYYNTNLAYQFPLKLGRTPQRKKSNSDCLQTIKRNTFSKCYDYKISGRLSLPYTTNYSYCQVF